MRTSKLFCISVISIFRVSACFSTNLTEEVDLRMFKNILRYSFEGSSCVAVHKDEHEFGNAYYEALFQSGIPIILQGYQKYCQGYIIFTKDVYGLENIMKEFRKFYYERFLCYIFESTNLTKYIQNHSEIFGEAEVLLSSSNEIYKRNTISKTFSPVVINNYTNPLGKYKPIYNFMGREFKLGAFVVPIFANYGRLDTHGKPDWIKGIELTAFDMIAKFINISWIIRNPPADGHSWGKKMANGSWTAGIFRMLDMGEVDVAMGCIFLTFEKYESFSFPNVMDVVRLRHLVRRPKLLPPDWSSIFRPLPLPVWIILLLEIVIHTLSVSCVTRIRRKLDEGFIYKEYSNLWNSNFLTLGILFMTGIPSSKKEQGPLRYLINSWVVACLLVTTCFGSSLVSNLTTPDLEDRPDTMEGLVKEGYFWGLFYKPHTALFYNMDNPWHRAWTDRFIKLKSIEHHLKLFDMDKFVLWGKSIDSMGFMLNEEYLHDKKLSQWEISNEIISSFYYTFAVAPTSPLILPLNRYISLLAQTGHISKLVKNEFMPESKKYMTEVLVKTKPRSVASILVINNFQGLFYLYFAGLLLAFLSFIYEMYYFKKKKIIRLM